MGFLVRPNDRKAVLQAIRISTCLWGGKYNCLIPILGKTPAWWSDHRWKPTAQEIIEGYINAFEPDYLVATHPGLGTELGLEKGELLQLDDVLSSKEDTDIRHGISTDEVFHSLYLKTYRFERRHRSKITLGKAVDHAFEAFTAAAFGAFPPELGYFEKNYITTFAPEDEPIDGKNLFENLSRQSPLTFGATDLQVLPSSWTDKTLYFMDATNTIDLIDFWNLRALGWPIKPIPQQWTEALVEPIKAYVEKNHVPYPNNPTMYSTTTLLRGRKASDPAFRLFAKTIRPPKGGLVTMDWHPRIWDEVARGYDHAHRAIITADEKDEQCTIEDGRAWFTPLAPSFLEKHRSGDTPDWVNVLTFRDYHQDGQVATLIPPGIEETGRLLGKSYPFTVTATREGIIFRTQRAWTEYIAVPDSLTVIQHWLQQSGMDAQPSGAGQVAKQLITNLKGLNGARLIAHADVLKLLDRMTHARVEHHLKVFGLLLKANENNKEMASRHLQRMLDTAIWRVGLRLQCPACSQHNWYPLTEIKD